MTDLKIKDFIARTVPNRLSLAETLDKMKSLYKSIAFESRIVNGEFEITYRPEERKPVREYLAPQKRFRHLDDELIEKIQKYVDAECEELGL